jgi:dTDP-4-amino-4,6-dideoxygalactose transaminase
MEAGHNTLVPLFDPHGEAQALRPQIVTALMKVIDGAMYILGTEVTAFEKALAISIGAKEAIGVASGTDALALALQAVGVAHGDEVITVSHTAGPTVAAIYMAGGTPVLVDIDPKTYCMDPAKLKAALSSKTKAIIVVHLYGYSADLAAIRAAAPGIAIVEDCAQAQGALSNGNPVGSMGDIACFSFYPTKNLGGIGDGGAIVCSDSAIADRARRLRTYGWTAPQFAGLEDGRCSRLDEIQAAILSVKLTALPRYITRRRAIAARYQAGLSDLPIILPWEARGNKHAFHLYVIRTQKRQALESHLRNAGILTGWHYPFPVHKQPGLVCRARIPEPLTTTEQIGGEILSLPMFATMTDVQTDLVISAIRAFFS